MKERIQKIMANAGYCSRRAAEDLIIDGKVKVNGKVAKIGDTADPAHDMILVEGKPLRRPRRIYLALNKPVGYETTLNSTSGKDTVISLIRTKERIIPIGRLDTDSRGLLLLTNDGDFANRIMHPRYEVEKAYHVKVRGEIPDYKIELMEKGIMLEEGITAPCKIKIIKRSSDTTMLSIILHEGKKRQIRRMIEKVGFQVLDLIRTRVGNITVGGIKEGCYRELKPNELTELRKLSGMC